MERLSISGSSAVAAPIGTPVKGPQTPSLPATPRAPLSARTPGSTPRHMASPRQPLTARADLGASNQDHVLSGNRGMFGSQRDTMDEFSADMQERHLKDVMYQRTYQLKKICRQLDPNNTGTVPQDKLTAKIMTAMVLGEAYLACLSNYLSQFSAGGHTSYEGLLQAIANANHGLGRKTVVKDKEKNRFAARGIMDPKIQAMMLEGEDDMGLTKNRPAHVIGDCAINPPFGIEGDAQKMENLIDKYMQERTFNVEKFFKETDLNGDGKLQPMEFAIALRKIDPHCPKATIEEYFFALDVEGKGWISINNIRNNFGVEFMKKKSQRSSPGQQDILSWPLSIQNHPSKQELMEMVRNRPSPRITPAVTRTMKFRNQAVKEVLQDTDPDRAIRMGHISHMKDNGTLRSELKMKGEIPIVATDVDKRTPLSANKKAPRPHYRCLPPDFV